MPITFKLETLYKSARVYLVGKKDRAVINKTFDKIYIQGKITWSDQPIEFSQLVFVVQKDTLNSSKDRVVVNIRGLNKITVFNLYPLLS